MSKSILLLGGVLPAVHLLRRMHKLTTNIHIIAQSDDLITYSKYGKKFIYKDSTECLPTIREWIQQNSKQSNEWLVIPCSEFFVQYIKEFRDCKFDVFAPSSKSLDIFYNKIALYSWLDTLDITISEFKQLNETLDFSDNKQYIIKCAKASDEYNPAFKTKIINKQAQIDDIRNSVPKKFWSNFVIQRFHDNNTSISYGGVWISGKEIAGIISEQVRQYPQGITSHTRLSVNEQDINIIRNALSKIAEHTELHGFIELEFVKNNCGLYPIDLNPRLWGWSNFLFYNFPELPSLIMELKCERSLLSNNVMSWSNIWRDVPAIINDSKPVLSKVNSILLLTKVSRKDFINWHDLKPEISSLLKRIKKYRKR